jgi:hypothetical protein
MTAWAGTIDRAHAKERRTEIRHSDLRPVPAPGGGANTESSSDQALQPEYTIGPCVPALVSCAVADARALSSVSPTAANKWVVSLELCATARHPMAVGTTTASLSAHPPNWLLQVRSASRLALANVGEVRTTQPPLLFQPSAMALYPAEPFPNERRRATNFRRIVRDPRPGY